MQSYLSNASGAIQIPVNQNVRQRVDVRDRVALANAYMKMFSGASWVRWANGDCLGRAWQGALEMCGTIVGAKQKSNNPAAQHLNNVYVAHKKYWSRIIMTNRSSDSVINANSEDVVSKSEYGKRLMGEGLGEINIILARYQERVEEKQKAEFMRGYKSVSAVRGGMMGDVKQTQSKPVQSHTTASESVRSTPDVRNNLQYWVWLLKMLQKWLEKHNHKSVGGQKRAALAVNYAPAKPRVKKYVPKRSSLQPLVKPMAKPEKSNAAVVTRVAAVNKAKQMAAAKKRVMNMTLNLQYMIQMQLMRNKNQRAV